MSTTKTEDEINLDNYPIGTRVFYILMAISAFLLWFWAAFSTIRYQTRFPPGSNIIIVNIFTYIF